MKSPVRRLLSGFAAVFFATSMAHAHPGHDGHELTWDFRHLAEHPLATVGWVVVFGAVLWAGGRLAHAIRSTRK